MRFGQSPPHIQDQQLLNLAQKRELPLMDCHLKGHQYNLSSKNVSGGFTHLVKGSTNTSGEVSIVPKHSNHGNLLTAAKASGRGVGVREDAVVRGWENDLSVVCKLNRGIPPSGEIRISGIPQHRGGSPPISKPTLRNIQVRPPLATTKTGTKSPPAAKRPWHHPS